jgi:CHAD domain-containing protein
MASGQAPDQAPDNERTAMSSSPNPADRVAVHAERKRQPRRRSTPRLHAGMTCDTAFRMIARSCLEDLTQNQEATCRGNHAALHEMRIALTRLRAAISLFSPMVVDSEWIRLKRELKWLNAQLGATRDMDVAVERLQQIRKRQPRRMSYFRSWQKKCTDRHRQLARALRSAGYRWLIKSAADWVESGSWSTKSNERAAKRRAAEVTRYGARKLARWHEKLLNKSRRLEDMGTKKRHRLRLANKRLRYSMEFLAGLLAGNSSSMRTTLKHLRRAQDALGELNDASKRQTIAATLERNAVPPEESQSLDRKRAKQLMRSAARAYRKMDPLKPLSI